MLKNATPITQEQLKEWSGHYRASEARQIATKRMVDDAEALGADAIVGVRYGSSQVMQGAAEVIAYGTAVKIIG